MYERLDSVALSFGAADTVVTKSIKESLVTRKSCPLAMVKLAKLRIPNFSGTFTATLSILDHEGTALFSKASIAKNTVTVIKIDELKDVLVEDSSKINVTLTGAAGSVDNVVVDLYVHRD